MRRICRSVGRIRRGPRPRPEVKLGKVEPRKLFRPDILVCGEIRVRDRERFLSRRSTLVVPGEREWMINHG